ncbi:hypothetical protein XPU_2767 [Xanthomonas arboricola pv. pruni str. MAFF 311562]|uniref:Uncharacterized protein n=1 Tax=Xanthomonas arboricola pv. pruni str. MAFF 311562 TaxID=1414836 RepID=W4S3N3_9XANT|nr:hypothetical protein XPU_2767 [Xanthomonas arboricola pv. pruni str. MAFF 311562]
MHARLAQQIRRQPAQRPLGADVRAGAQIHPQSFLLAELDKCNEIAFAGVEIELPRLAFVGVPHQVQRDGVQAQRLGHADALQPVRPGDAQRMHLAAAELPRLLIQHELAALEAERMRAAIRQRRMQRRQQRRRGRQTERCEQAERAQTPAFHRCSREWKESLRCAAQ